MVILYVLFFEILLAMCPDIPHQQQETAIYIIYKHTLLFWCLYFTPLYKCIWFCPVPIFELSKIFLFILLECTPLLID